jgi:hypothetical protein
MKISELKRIIDSHQALHPGEDDMEVVVLLDMFSAGPRAGTKVVSACRGIDWDSGRLLLKCEHPISIKTENESIFQMGRDLLGWIATKPTKKQSYEQSTALKVFERLNYDIMKYQKIFHHDA